MKTEVLLSETKTGENSDPHSYPVRKVGEDV